MYLFRDNLPKLKGNLRFIHAIPKAPSVDIYGNGILLGENIAFSDISNYIELSPGLYDIQLYKAGTYDTPLFKDNYEVVPNSYYTVSVVMLDENISFFSIKDASSFTSGETSFLRFIHLSPTAPLLTLSLSNGEVLFNSVEYLETTGYYPLSPGIYNFLVSASGASVLNKSIKNFTLKPGVFNTIYILGQLNDTPQLGYIYTNDGK